MKIPVLSFALATSLLLGCGSDPKKDPNTAARQGNGQNDRQNDDAKSSDDPRKSTIQIGEKLARLCDIPTAYFAFDSAALSHEARDALNALAKCFTTGPAKGKSMRVVGHADPRGELHYNFALGQKRAGIVAQYVVGKGVRAERVESSSRGELDARGTDESSWADDRKVAIYLADEDSDG